MINFLFFIIFLLFSFWNQIYFFPLLSFEFFSLFINSLLLPFNPLLLGFFNFYGFDFNYRKLGISIRNGCFLFRRTDESKNILCVENFQDIKQDMGKSCYQYKKIIDLFKFASRSLTSCTSPVISYLSLFIFPDEILKERNQKK